MSFVVVVGYFWDQAYQKGYDDAKRDYSR